jgi:NAD(P)H-hydrate repair Nnr-like enzyme with NAD(P)H-hydrate dehydratase domain
VAAAVYLHGLTADIVRDTLHENTVLASDLLDDLTEAFRNCDLQMDRGLFYLHK